MIVYLLEQRDNVVNPEEQYNYKNASINIGFSTYTVGQPCFKFVPDPLLYVPNVYRSVTLTSF